MYELVILSSSSIRKLLFITCLFGLSYIIVSFSQNFLQVSTSFELVTSTHNKSVRDSNSTQSIDASLYHHETNEEPREDFPTPNLQNKNTASNYAIPQVLPQRVAEPGHQARNSPTRPLWVTASLLGRLGNQMFIYASLIGIARSQHRYYFVESRTLLSNLFEIHHARDGIPTSGWRCEKQDKYATYLDSFMNLTHENVTLEGYFQSYRYFHKGENEVREEFRFLKSVQLEVRKVLARLENRTTVGVHVRRTDFLVRSGCGVPNVTYFTRAFRKLRALLPGKNLTFVVASDDLDWCAQNLRDRDVTVAPSADAVIHFALLASCDHVISSGGTFGWWAGWLSRGIKIYYKGFIVKGSRLEEGFKSHDYYPPEWIGMGD